MTIESENSLNDDVRAVLEYLEEWFGTNSLTPIFHDGDYMTIKIDMGRMVSDTCAAAVNWFIDNDWELEEISMAHRTITVYGSASNLPCSGR